MKQFTKILSLMAALLFIAVSALGEGALRGYDQTGYIYVTLGKYMQSIDGGIPEEKQNTWSWNHAIIKDADPDAIEKTPILWRVLSVDEEKAFLCSEYILFARPTHTNVTEYKTIGKDFGQTQLSAYLNGEFAQTAFTEAEMGMLLENSTMGKVFLLTTVQANDKKLGLGNHGAMKAWGTEYAVRVTRLHVYRVKSGAHSPYWLTDQASTDKRHARCTKATASVGHIIADRDNEGVRPAVWLDIHAFDITGGSGTKDDPYVLAPKSVQTNQ